MKNKAIEAYKRQNDSEQSRAKNMLLCYQNIIDASVRHDRIGIEQGLHLLEGSLNYQADPQLAFRLLKIYKYCEFCSSKERYDEVCRMISSLKTTWDEALKLHVLNSNASLPDVPDPQNK